MVKVHEAGALNFLAKKIAPFLSRLFMRGRLSTIPRLLETYAAIVQGKGSGTGWDIAGEIRAAVARIKNPHAVVFDVGANKGEWSKHMLRYLGEGSHIFQFEPALYCRNFLRKMDLPRTTLIEAAVGEAPGHAVLFSPNQGSGIASLHRRRDSYFDDKEFFEEKIEVVTIDDVIEERQIEFVDFMKMDLEGHELAALKGARRSMESGRIKALSFEFGSGHINSRVYFHDFWDLLRSHNFKIMRICPGGVCIDIDEYYEDLEYFRGVSNYLAVRDGT